MKNARKMPWMKFWVQVWIADRQVSACKASTRGIWWDWICNMHSSDRSGLISGDREALARLGRCSAVEVDHALADIITTRAGDVTDRNGLVTVINRRMRREWKARKQGSERVSRHRGNVDVTVQKKEGQEVRGKTKEDHQLNQLGVDEVEGRESKVEGQRANQVRMLEGRELTKLTGRGEMENAECRMQNPENLSLVTHHSSLLSVASLDRVVGDILSNRFAWAYDNCKVQPEDFPYRKSLVTVLSGFVGKVSELAAHSAWQEAVTRTHQAVTDGMVRIPGSYTVQCWKEAMGKEMQNAECRMQNGGGGK